MAQIRRHARLALGIVTAGAAGTTALFGPAQSASASSGVNWDAIAQCESGGNWNTHTGNGYSGGLQFSHSTWAAYGGKKYASSAHQASRSQQIAVAERVRRGQGIKAWPTCGSRSGSSKHYKSKKSSYTGTHRSTRSHVEETSYHRTVAHRTTRASQRTESQQATRTQRTTRVHTLRTSASVRPDGRWYVVRHGDTLSKIAAAKSVTGGWPALYQLNQAKLGNGPDLIMAGQRLAL